MLDVAELLQSISSDMVIGNNQSVRGNKRAAALAIKANAALLDMFQPSWVWREVILVLQLLNRWSVEQPKAFVGSAIARDKNDQRKSQVRNDLEKKMLHRDECCDSAERWGACQMGWATIVFTRFRRRDGPCGSPKKLPTTEERGRVPTHPWVRLEAPSP